MDRQRFVTLMVWSVLPYSSMERRVSLDDANIGKGSGQDERERAEQIGFAIKSIVESGRYKPPLLPEVAELLMTLARRPDVRIAEIETIVCRDPTVAARVLRVANSPFYRGVREFTSLSAAITRIGLREVRDIAFQVAAMSTIFRVPGYTERMRQLSAAAVASGEVAREACRILGIDSETAFLCGLLHDMGEAAILGIVAEGCRAKRQPVPPLRTLALTIEGYHELVGAWITKHWGLPQVITDAILDHHHPERSLDKMPLVLAATDLVVEHAAGRNDEDLDAATLFMDLELAGAELASLVEFAKKLLATPTHR
jgi:putative nucleotidyltransferase with HDIG domain